MERKISTEKARQGRWGVRVLLILVCALVLAGVVWLGVEMYGRSLAEQPAATHLDN
jgi:hypothetical protein